MRRVKNQSDFLDPSPDHDPVFETLLNEAFGGAAPRDQTEDILERIELSLAPTGSAVAASLPQTVTRTGRRRVKVLAWSTLLAVAASLAWIVLTAAPQFDSPEKNPSFAQADRDAGETKDDAQDDRSRGRNEDNIGSFDDGGSISSADSFAGVDARERNGAAPYRTIESPGEGKSSQQVPMKMRDVPFGNELAMADERPDIAASPTMPAPAAKQSSREIVDRINSHLMSAWESLSLVRAETADSAEIAERFERTIAVSLTPDEYSLPDQIRQRIATPEGHATIAQAIVKELLGPSAASRLRPEQHSILAARVASAFTGQAGFDEVIRMLYLGGEDEDASKASQTWLAALAGGQSVPITEQTARALLDLDLQCGRCHKHPIESGIGQQDYWQFAALFDNGLYYTRSDDGQPRVHLKETASVPPEGVFFELPDGRQRIALPSVSADWLGVPGAQPIDQLSELSSYWIDNPQLAKSTVNRLWKIVYGRPLVGSASNPGAPPRDEHLTALRDFLGEQLRAYDFDLAAAASWILAAEPMRLQVASSMKSEKIRTASAEELLQAEDQTRAFAAYQPIERRESFLSLISQAAQWNGGTTIDQLPTGSTLAQPVDGGSDRSGETETPKPDDFRQQWLRASFPTVSTVTSKRPDLPAQWLASLKSFDQQARHLYYAAGYWHPSQSQMQAAELLRASSDDANLALSQLWWAIENGAE